MQRYLESSPASPTTFEPGDMVLVRYPGRAPGLAPMWRGPLAIVDDEAPGEAWRCQDLNTHRIVAFDISRLKRYDASRTEDPAALAAAADSNEWIVEAIVDHRLRANCRKRIKTNFEFLVRWEGFGSDDDEWLPYNAVSHLEALDSYHRLHPALPL